MHHVTLKINCNGLVLSPCTTGQKIRLCQRKILTTSEHLEVIETMFNSTWAPQSPVAFSSIAQLESSNEKDKQMIVTFAPFVTSEEQRKEEE